MAGWNTELARARKALGLSVEDAASRAGVGVWTLRSYEMGRRRPTRPRLIALLDALNIDMTERNAILTDAGFAAALPLGGRMLTERYLDVPRAAAEIASRPWPSVVVDEMVNLRAANDLFLKLWGIPRSRLEDAIGRNALTMVTERRVADRCLLWDETVANLIRLFKARERRPESLHDPSPAFAAVLERVYAGDATYVRRFVDLWDDVPGLYPGRVTWTYPMHWRVPAVGDFRFECIAYSVNEFDCLDVDEWIPADTATYRLIEKLRARRLPGR